MIERGDYVNPTFNYEPRINKPVLSYWIVAAFYHLFGISPGVQRIPIALGGLVLIGVAFLLARAAAPPQHRIAAAWWAALGLAISPRLLMFARRIFIDIYISMFMALTLLFFALAERYPQRRRLFLLLMYASVGLGVLTKGPMAALLPGLVFAVYLLVHRELGRVREMLIPIGLVVVLAIVVAVVRRALSAVRLGAHQVVPRRREPESLRRRRRRQRRSSRPVLVPAGRLQRLVSLVVSAGSGGNDVVPRAPTARPARRPGRPRPHPAVAVDPGDRRVLLAVGGEAGSLHLPDRPGRRGARPRWRSCACSTRRRRTARRRSAPWCR